MSTTMVAPAVRPRLFTQQWWRRLLMALLALLVLLTVAASMPLSPEDATRLQEQFGEQIPDGVSTEFIFANNVRIGLAMLLPVLGPIIGGIALYQTGLIFAAVGVTTGVPGGVLLLATMLFPFFWLEMVAYAAAIGQSVFLLTGFWNHRVRFEARRTLVVAGLVGLLLFIGAVVEAVLISFAGQLG